MITSPERLDKLDKDKGKYHIKRFYRKDLSG